ncbi:MAG: hypothetical protein SFX73_31725 [Kofleriaceae bacterium]|nr:hypothetical protein [Kofleriaceae bacterium]
MRWLLCFGLVCLPMFALAKPKVAVAPLEGDDGGKVAEVVVEVAGESAKVIGPGETKKAMAKHDVDELDGKGIKKLRKKLAVDAVIHGKVEEDGTRKTLALEVSVRGKKTERFSLSFRGHTSKKLREELREELGKRLSEGEGDEDPDEDDAPKPRRDDDDQPRKKKRRRDDDDLPRERNPLTQAALRVGAGASATRRTLTYATTSATPPPRVGTLSGSVRLEGEVYPASFDTLKGTAARLGVAFELDKTVGLGIRVPGAGGAEATIDKLHVQVGARYRIPFGQSSLALGAGYYLRRYKADRGGAGLNLDMPDVDYRAITLGGVGRFVLGPKLGLALALDLPLMLSAGSIQSPLSYGPAKIIAFDLDVALEYRLAPRWSLKTALELSNIMVTFDGKMGTQSAARMVQGATDRNLGLAVTLEALY